MLFFNYSMILLFSLSTVVVSIIILLSSTMVSVFAFSIFSLFSAIIYLILMAPDVAITEAAVGSAISTIFFLMAMRAIDNNIGKKKNFDSKYTKIANAIKKMSISRNIYIFIIAIIIILIGVCDAFIEVGDIKDVEFKSSKYYITNSMQETGIKNIVTSVLASYRGFDTFIENTVILVAAIGVICILRSDEE